MLSESSSSKNLSENLKSTFYLTINWDPDGSGLFQQSCKNKLVMENFYALSLMLRFLKSIRAVLLRMKVILDPAIIMVFFVLGIKWEFSLLSRYLVIRE